MWASLGNRYVALVDLETDRGNTFKKGTIFVLARYDQLGDWTCCEMRENTAPPPLHGILERDRRRVFRISKEGMKEKFQVHTGDRNAIKAEV